MSSTTENYNLHKIDLADSPPDITVLNQNFDTIDAELKKAETERNSVRSITKGGTGATAVSAARVNLGVMQTLATYFGSGSVDINTVKDSLMLVPKDSTKNCPVTGNFVFIMQLFYATQGENNNQRTQIAFPYANGEGMAIRTYNSGNWSEWDLFFCEHNKPTGTYTGNGDATSRTISVGGLGVYGCLFIQSSYGIAVVGAWGGIVANTSGSVVEFIPQSQLRYYNNTLTLATTHRALNTESGNYTYCRLY